MTMLVNVIVFVSPGLSQIERFAAPIQETIPSKLNVSGLRSRSLTTFNLTAEIVDSVCLEKWYYKDASGLSSGNFKKLCLNIAPTMITLTSAKPAVELQVLNRGQLPVFVDLDLNDSGTEKRVRFAPRFFRLEMCERQTIRLSSDFTSEKYVKQRIFSLKIRSCPIFSIKEQNCLKSENLTRQSDIVEMQIPVSCSFMDGQP